VNLTEAQLSLQLFPGYTEADTSIFAEFIDRRAKPEPGFVVDFLGSRIRTTSLWQAARAFEGKAPEIPVPGDFHAETIEWIGLLKAVRSASEKYVAMELGAGFGPWIIAGAVAARHRGIADIRLCAVEGDSHHFQFLRQHFSDNGFDPEKHDLIEAVVGVKNGVARWPANSAPAAEEWGSRPVEGGRDYRGLPVEQTRPVKIIPLRDLILKQPAWDLIHIDVQGHEVNICRSCMDDLTSRVRWIIAATHSRKLDGDFLELMHSAGWILEHEKPSKFAFSPGAASLEAMTLLDGTQVWRNPGVMRPGDPLTSFSQEISTLADQVRAPAGSSTTLPITVCNTGTQPWFGRVPQSPVNVSYRWLDPSGNMLPIEGLRTPLTRPATYPGESDRLDLTMRMPAVPGSYRLLVSLVQEGVSWFHDKGAHPLVLAAVAV
jgi:FkbM family methyltransferase